MAVLVETIEGGNNEEIPSEDLRPPRPSGVMIIDRDAFSVDVPPIGKGSIQYAPDNVDLLRYRLGKNRTQSGKIYDLILLIGPHYLIIKKRSLPLRQLIAQASSQKTVPIQPMAAPLTKIGLMQ